MKDNEIRINITDNLNNTKQIIRKTKIQENGPIDIGDDIIF